METTSTTWKCVPRNSARQWHQLWETVVALPPKWGVLDYSSKPSWTFYSTSAKVPKALSESCPLPSTSTGNKKVEHRKCAVATTTLWVTYLRIEDGRGASRSGSN